MAMDSSLHTLIEQLPADLKQEVHDFAAFLLEKRGKQQRSKKPRIMDLHKGQFWMSDDFDDPLPDEFWLGKDA